MKPRFRPIGLSAAFLACLFVCGRLSAAEQAAIPTTNLALAAPSHFDVHVNDLSDEACRTGGHADAIRLFRDGEKPEDKRLLLTHCGGNRMDMLDGNGKIFWSVTGLHFESVFFGELDKDVPGQEKVGPGRRTGPRHRQTLSHLR